MQSSIDQLWVIVCIGLVFLMQPGFLAFESGLTRSKNSVNVAIKNLTDFCLSLALFWIVGYTLMFGATHSGLIGGDLAALFTPLSEEQYIFFIFQAMFCGTAATIVSGAVAERMNFRGYIMVTVVISIVIYPVFGHWAWNGLEAGTHQGWLAARGFVDFAGTTVVHGTGAWVALAAIIILGPRLGRFNKNGTHNSITGNNLPLSMAGVLLLWIGWIGFNGGSAGGFTPEVPKIILNTFLSGTAGFLTTLIISWKILKYTHGGLLMNGAIAGLVAITANCNVVASHEAILIGAIGGIVMMVVDQLLLKLKLDDVVGVVGAHGGAGVWGTLAVAFFADSATLQTGLTFGEQLLIQMTGVAANFLWGFGIAYLVLRLINRFLPLRVSFEDEVVGLNVSAHHAPNEIQSLVDVLDLQTRSQNFDLRVPVDPYTEAGQISKRYNKVLDMLQESLLKSDAANKAKSEFLATMSHEIRTPMNAILGLSDLLKESHLNAQDKNYVSLINKSGNNLLTLVNGILDLSKVESGHLKLDPQPMNLHELVDDIGQSLAYNGYKKGVSLKIRYASALPDWFIADADGIQKILINLIGNAIKFTEKGYVFVDIDGVVTDENAKLSLRVSDSGIGISEAQSKIIFDQFNQADGSTTRKYGGTGLGLAITKALVELMGGEISVTSQAGQGAEFSITLTLPLHKQQPLPAVDLSHLKVLHVCNDEIDQAIIKEIVEHHDVIYTSIDSLQNATTFFTISSDKPQTVDCILIDIDSTTKAWKSTITELKEHASISAPMVILSSDRDTSSPAMESTQPYHAWIRKPIEHTRLTTVLAELNSHQSAHNNATLPEQNIKQTYHFSLDILVIDDDKVNRIVAKSLLMKMGCSIDTATSGKEAIQKIEHQEYDVIFMDCMMPEMNGYEATKAIRALEAASSEKIHRTIIAMTANNMNGDKERCLASGMDDFISKPINTMGLAEVLKKYQKLI